MELVEKYDADLMAMMKIRRIYTFINP